MGDLSKNFSLSEFKCKCGECDQIDPPLELVNELQELRDHFGASVKIHSGHRCPAYNAKVGGAEYSQHLKATAADHTVDGKSPTEVQAYWIKRHPEKFGIGRYNTFTHFDVRPYKARWDNRT